MTDRQRLTASSKFALLYVTAAGHIGVWSDHETRESAQEAAIARTEFTGRSHWIAEVQEVAEPTPPHLRAWP